MLGNSYTLTLCPGKAGNAMSKASATTVISHFALKNKLVLGIHSNLGEFWKGGIAHAP